MTTIGQADVESVKVSIPHSNEQQKIADCLSSIDDLLTLETQKLAALKSHKKGLMQQLFPAEGNHPAPAGHPSSGGAFVPKLRFPEFRDAGEWGNKKFGEICKFVRGPFGGALTKDIFVKDGYAVYEQSHAIYQNFDSFRYFITEEKYNELKRFSVQSNDIIMSCSGTMGKFAVIPTEPKEGVINQALLKLTVNKEYDLDFVKFTLELPINQENLLSQSAGGAIKNVVGVSELKEIEMPAPSLKEQQKIADFIFSIDELITAQSKKIDTLKAHKKGLMQQLFPSVGGVAGEA
jgi:type I restriction enzyme S subunit